MMACGAVLDRLVGAAFAREHCVLGFDGLVRTDRRRYLEELAEQLAAEHAMVFQVLIAALELGDVPLAGAPRRHRVQIKTGQ